MKICKIEGCSSNFYAKDLCEKHYTRLRINGDPLISKTNREHNSKCSVLGCCRKFFSKDVCKEHYNELYYSKNTDKIRLKSREYRMEHKKELEAYRKSRVYTSEQKATIKKRTYESYLITKFNINIDQYNEILVHQNYCCALCKRHRNKFRKNFAVDHTHSCCFEGSCGKCIRGLLCDTCNRAVGLLKDDASWFLNGYNYLNKYL